MFLTTTLAYKIISMYVPLGIFALFFLLTLYSYFWKPGWLSKILWWGIGVIAVMHVAVALYWTWLLYVTWQGNAFSQFLLPPHEPIAYFWQYSWTHYLSVLPWLLGGAVAMGAIILAIGALSRGRMVDTTDAKLAVFGSLIVGWPNMLSFLMLTLALTLLGAVGYGIISKQKRIIMTATPFFFPSIVVVFWFGSAITKFLGLGQLVV